MFAAERVMLAREQAAFRDKRMRDIRLVRRGDLDSIAPDLFSADWPKPVVANWIEAAALDLAGNIAPLPAVNCASRSMKSDVDKRKASKKNKIADSYWRESRLATDMMRHGADRYITYGFLPFYVEADYENSCPKIRVMDPVGCYYSKDRFGDVKWFSRVWVEPIRELIVKYPEAASSLLLDMNAGAGHERLGDIEVVQYCDEKHWMLYVPSRSDLILGQYEHGLGSCPVVIPERPGLDDETRGQFDQVWWVQLARGYMALLAMEAGTKAVQAPLVVPNDVRTLPIGPDAVIRTDNRAGVGRIPLEVPQSAFKIGDDLADEMKIGAGYPEGRMGGVDASVITGRGMQQLLGGFDTQIKSAQTMLADALSRITSKAFELDSKTWPMAKKRIVGSQLGQPYDEMYTPGMDIGDNYSCDVTYGYAAGLAPNQAIVLLLQLRGDGLISKDTVRRQLPFEVDIDQEQRELDVQEIQDSLKQGLQALLQSAPQMAAQGMDPMPALMAAAAVLKGRRTGKNLEELMLEAFKPPEPPPVDPAAEAAAPPGAEAAPPGPDQGAGGPPGAPPAQPQDLQMLMAGLRGGKPVMDATVSRRIPAAA